MVRDEVDQQWGYNAGALEVGGLTRVGIKEGEKRRLKNWVVYSIV